LDETDRENVTWPKQPVKDDGLMPVKHAMKAKPRHPDRVTLLPKHLEKMDGWIHQITTRQRGVRLTRNDIVAWLIDSQPVELSPKDEKALGEMHYDEERFLKEAIREIRARKARGESGSLAELLKNWTARPATERPAPKSRRPAKPIPPLTEETTTLEGGHSSPL
jgi:hypothetical protein